MLWAFGGFLSAISVGTQAITRRIGEGEIKKAGRVLYEFANGRRAIKHRRDLFALFIARPIFNFIGEDTAVQEAGTIYGKDKIRQILSMVLMASYKDFTTG